VRPTECAARIAIQKIQAKRDRWRLKEKDKRGSIGVRFLREHGDQV
jgi:hypothetical protein